MKGLIAYILSKKASKAYTDEKIALLGKGMEYKGSVATVADLPTSGNEKGYVYTVTATHQEFVWTGTEWEELGGSYTAGDGISIDDGEIGVDFNLVASVNYVDEKVPTSGTTGHVLTKTDEGTEWAEAGGSSAEYFSVPVSTTGWTKDAAANWYTQTVAVTDILATDKPDADVDLSMLTASEDVEAALVAWQNIFRISVANGSVTLYAGQATETAITVALRCVR